MTPISGSAESFGTALLPYPSPSSENVIAAVDVQRLAGHRRAVGAGQKHAGGADFLDRDQPARRRAIRDPFHQIIEIGNAGGGAGRQRPGADRVHADAARSEFGRHIAHRRFERRLDRSHDPVILDDLVGARDSSS